MLAGVTGRAQLLCMSIPRIAHFRLNFQDLVSTALGARLLMSAEVKFEASGLGQEWDVVDVLRDRMRGGHNLLLGTLHEFTVQRACKNIDVLTPVLVRCAEANLRTPEVECLRAEIQSFYQMHQRTESEDTIDDLAWEVRKLLSFVKRKTQRKEVSTAPGLQLSSCFD